MKTVTYWAFPKIENPEEFWEYDFPTGQVFVPEKSAWLSLFAVAPGFRSEAGSAIVVRVTFVSANETPFYKVEISEEFGERFALRKIEAFASENFAAAAGFCGAVLAFESAASESTAG